MDLLSQAGPAVWSTEWLRRHGVTILVIIVAAIIVSMIARLAVRRMQTRMQRAETGTQEIALARSTTITHALTSAVRWVVWTIAVLLILGEFNINLAPLIAGAGVAGVALGFGAQSLVRDVLAGFFILFENQYGVAQTVDLMTIQGPVTGKVEDLSLRATQVRSFDGTLHVVPNGNIVYIGNRSAGWARAIVDVRVAYGQDVGSIRQVLDDLFDEMRADPSFEGDFYAGPTVLGIETLGNVDMVIRVVAETRPSRRPAVERGLRSRILHRFAERGVSTPPVPASPASSQPPAR